MWIALTSSEKHVKNPTILVNTDNIAVIHDVSNGATGAKSALEMIRGGCLIDVRETQTEILARIPST